MTIQLATFLIALFLLDGIALGQMTEIHVILNAKDQTAEVFKAPQEAINQTLHWQLGTDQDFLPQKSLIEIARKSAKLPGGGKDYDLGPILGVEWKRINLGWVVIVHFHARRRQFHGDGALPIKDDGIPLAVPLLPNGAAVVIETRPLTNVEKVSLGLMPQPDKEVDDPFTGKK